MRNAATCHVIALAFISLIVVPLLALAATAANDRPAGPYPPDIASWDEHTKQAQREAGRALLDRLHEAIEAGRESISIDQGHYRFSVTEGARPYHIGLRDIDGMTIDCNGSTFWFEKQATAIAINGCTDLTLKDLIVDWDPLPYTQGTIAAVDHETNTIEVKLAEGYERVTETFAVGKGTIRGALFDAQTHRLKPDQYGFRVEPFWESRLPNSHYRIQVRGFYRKSVGEIGFEPGDLIALWLRAGRTLRIEGCERVMLENVTMYASGFVCFVEAAGPGPNTYRRCRILRRPNTNRLIAGNADGFNSSRQRRGPILEGCEAEAIGDDFVNVHGHYYKVLWQESPTQIITDRIGWRGRLAEDIELLFYRADDHGFVAERTGVENEPIQWELDRDRSLFDEATGWRSGGHGDLPFGKKVPAHRITLDRPLQVPDGTIVSCEDYIGAGAVIRNCSFTNGLANGIRLQSHHATIDSNRLEWIAGWGIVMQSHPGFWGEAGDVHHAAIRGNRFIDTCIFQPMVPKAAIGINTPGDLEATRLQHDIQITDNAILRPGQHGLFVKGGGDIAVTDNRIQSYGNRHAGNAIWLDTVRGVELRDNDISDPGKYAGEPIGRRAAGEAPEEQH